MIHAARLCNATICAHVHAVAVHWTKERNSQTTHLAFKWILANQKLKGCCPPNSWVGEGKDGERCQAAHRLEGSGKSSGIDRDEVGGAGRFPGHVIARSPPMSWCCSPCHGERYGRPPMLLGSYQSNRHSPRNAQTATSYRAKLYSPQ